MGTRAQDFATQLTQLNNDVTTLVSGLSDAQWNAPCGSDSRTIGVVVHHIAHSYQPTAELAQVVATGGQLPPLTMEMIDQMNAKHAMEHAAVGKAEVLEELPRYSSAAANIIAGLSDEQLERTASIFGGPMITAAQMIHGIVLGHARDHLQCIREALAN